MEPEEMTHEVTLGFPYGNITFQIAASYYGEGEVDDGITLMLHEMYPTAKVITLYELPKD